jgi:hypothetical protein
MLEARFLSLRDMVERQKVAPSVFGHRKQAQMVLAASCISLQGTLLMAFQVRFSCGLVQQLVEPLEILVSWSELAMPPTVGALPFLRVRTRRLQPMMLRQPVELSRWSLGTVDPHRAVRSVSALQKAGVAKGHQDRSRSALVTPQRVAVATSSFVAAMPFQVQAGV